MAMENAIKPNILVVDDTETNIDILVETLGDDYDVSVAMDGMSAITDATENPPDLILLDIMMPGMDGYEVCQRLKVNEKTKDIPVIFVTAMNEIGNETKGFEMGAVDYITKPISPPVVRSRVQSHLEIKQKTEELTFLSTELSKYLSPQVYESIFSGERRASIESQRKKLTVFFSDIVGFTSTTERMEAEDISHLLNSYLDGMAKIAIKYGGTIDKFVGDAIMVFFGDPTSKGVKEDALACVSMALEMLDALKDLQKDWYHKGVTTPFKIRVGINTGFCTVGNFGSSSKMDYTIIGGQVNISKRLEEVAQEGEIVISHETWSQINEEIYCIKQKPVIVKGIPNPIQTYQVVGFNDKIEQSDRTFSVGVLAEKVDAIAPETLVRDIELGRRLGESFVPIVVAKEGEPVGLLMNYHLIRLLSSQSHRAQFFEKPVTSVMDTSALVVESNTPLEKVARQAMARDHSKIYDHIIVTDKGVLMGTVAIYSILDKLASLSMEQKPQVEE